MNIAALVSAAKPELHPLQNIPLFRHISPDGWRRLRKLAPVHSYRPGNILFYQGNAPLGLHFICSGRVKLVKQDSSGRCQIVRIVSGPDLLGDRAFFAEKPYACTGEVMEPSDICFLEPARFWEFFGRNADMLRLLARKFAVELGRAEEYMHCLAVCTINARLATRLLRPDKPHACTRKPANELILTETRTELAQMLGTTPEAVSRALAKLCSKGLIAVSGQRVRILNEERLRLVACLHAGVA